LEKKNYKHQCTWGTQTKKLIVKGGEPKETRPGTTRKERADKQFSFPPKNDNSNFS